MFVDPKFGTRTLKKGARLMADASATPIIDAATQMQLRDQAECERMINAFITENLLTLSNLSHLA